MTRLFLFSILISFFFFFTQCSSQSITEKTINPEKKECQLEEALLTGIKELFLKPKNLMNTLIKLQIDCKSRFISQNSDIIGLLDLGERKIIRVHALNPESNLSKIKARKFKNRYYCDPLMINPSSIEKLNQRTRLQITGIPVNLGILEKKDINLSTGENYINQYQYIDIELIELN